MYASPKAQLSKALNVQIDEKRRQEYFTDAIRLLHKYPTKIDPVLAIESLPPDTKISDIAKYVRIVLQYQNLKSHDGGLLCKLLRTELLTQSHQLKIMENTRINVDDSVNCAMCLKRLNTR